MSPAGNALARKILYRPPPAVNASMRPQTASGPCSRSSGCAPVRKPARRSAPPRRPPARSRAAFRRRPRRLWY